SCPFTDDNHRLKGQDLPMIAGLSLASWALIVISFGAGLAIEIAFLRAHRDEATRRGQAQ
ncbi:MAG: hypothetical protein WD690_19670, partial [Vicinamibacterales bacterium]